MVLASPRLLIAKVLTWFCDPLANRRLNVIVLLRLRPGRLLPWNLTLRVVETSGLGDGLVPGDGVTPGLGLTSGEGETPGLGVTSGEAPGEGLTPGDGVAPVPATISVLSAETDAKISSGSSPEAMAVMMLLSFLLPGVKSKVTLVFAVVESGLKVTVAKAMLLPLTGEAVEPMLPETEMVPAVLL